MKKTILTLPFAILLVILVSGCTSPDVTGDVVAGSDVMLISVSDIGSQARWYEYNSGGATVRFFAVKASDGSIKTAFDACDVCYPEKRGYRQDGDFMICNNCGQSFHETKINIIRGGCNPAPVDRIFDNQFVYVSIDSLQQGAAYF